MILERYEGDTEELDKALAAESKRKKFAPEVARLNRALGVA